MGKVSFHNDHGSLAGLADDDHTQYQLRTEKGAASGYASLDSGTKVPTVELGGSGADATKYLRGDQTWQVVSTDHGGLTGLEDDDHTQYRLESADHTHQSTGAQAGQLDHGLALTGLTDDDHTQYLLLAGRAGGQSVYGGTAASNTLVLASTSDATRGVLQLIGNVVTVNDISEGYKNTLEKFSILANDEYAKALFYTASASARFPIQTYMRARGTVASPSAVASGDVLGLFSFDGYVGAAAQGAVQLYAEVDGTPSTYVPGRLRFLIATAADGLIERMRIDSSGSVGIGATSPGQLVELEQTQTITGAVTDGYAAALRLDPCYTAATALTVTRHNYIDVQDVSVAGAGPAAVTNAALFRFDANIGTHKALAAAFTTTDSGTDTTSWAGGIIVNVNGTLYKVPFVAV